MEMIPIREGRLSAAGYDSSTGEIHIELREEGSVAYKAPFVVYEALMATGSKGAFYALHIEGQYPERSVN